MKVSSITNCSVVIVGRLEYLDNCFKKLEKVLLIHGFLHWSHPLLAVVDGNQLFTQSCIFEQLPYSHVLAEPLQLRLAEPQLLVWNIVCLHERISSRLESRFFFGGLASFALAQCAVNSEALHAAVGWLTLAAFILFCLVADYAIHQLQFIIAIGSLLPKNSENIRSLIHNANRFIFWFEDFPLQPIWLKWHQSI